MLHSGEKEIVDYGMSLVRALVPVEDNSQFLEDVFVSFLRDEISYQNATEVFNDSLGSIKPLEVIKDIVEESKKSSPLKTTNSSKNRPRHWTSKEDIRLLAGLLIYGPKEWTKIAFFVGANRGRAQCLQRWSRTLKPTIAKEIWTNEDDKKLVDIIRDIGKLSWTTISKRMGNRSDVQCRYHFAQLVKTNRVQLREEPGIDGDSEPRQVPIFNPQIKLKQIRRYTPRAGLEDVAPVPIPEKTKMEYIKVMDQAQHTNESMVTARYYQPVIPIQPQYIISPAISVPCVVPVPKQPQGNVVVQVKHESKLYPIAVDEFLSMF